MHLTVSHDELEIVEGSGLIAYLITLQTDGGGALTGDVTVDIVGSSDEIDVFPPSLTFFSADGPDQSATIFLKAHHDGRVTPAGDFIIQHFAHLSGDS